MMKRNMMACLLVLWMPEQVHKVNGNGEFTKLLYCACGRVATVRTQVDYLDGDNDLCYSVSLSCETHKPTIRPRTAWEKERGFHEPSQRPIPYDADTLAELEALRLAGVQT